MIFCLGQCSRVTCGDPEESPDETLYLCMLHSYIFVFCFKIAYGCFKGGGGQTPQNLSLVCNFFLLPNKFYYVRDTVGCVWYVVEALEKRCSDMYGS